MESLLDSRVCVYIARNDVHCLSLMKKCSMRKLAVVNTTKKIPSRHMFSHQNDYDQNIRSQFTTV